KPSRWNLVSCERRVFIGWILKRRQSRKVTRQEFFARQDSLQRVVAPAAEPFVAEQEECSLFDDRPAHDSAELVLPKWRLLHVEELLCVEDLVAQEFIDAKVNVI